MTDKQVSIFGNNIVRDKANIATALSGSASLDPRGLPDGTIYLNFSGKLGRYGLGPDREDIDPDERWLVNVASFENGWICWKGGRPVARRMASIFEPPVAVPDPEEHGPFTDDRDGWSQAKALILKSLDSGIQVQFSTNSKSGVSSVAGLERAIAERVAANEAEWPVVNLRKERFTADGNVNFKPVFNLVAWFDEHALLALSEMETIEAEDVDRLIAEANGENAPSQSKVAKGDGPRRRSFRS